MTFNLLRNAYLQELHDDEELFDDEELLFHVSFKLQLFHILFIPFFISPTQKTIAIIPLVIYISGICATIITKPLTSFCGLKVCQQFICFLFFTIILFAHMSYFKHPGAES